MIPSLEINALLPHKLAQLCRIAGARLIHMSTDCVFSGGSATTPKAIRATPRTCMAEASILARSRTRIA